MKLIYPIDKQGFVDWDSIRYNPKPNDYIPEVDEVDTLIPIDTPWHQPRWDGEKWVEGGEVPKPMPLMPPIPTEQQILGQQITDLEISDIMQGQQVTSLELKLIMMGVDSDV